MARLHVNIDAAIIEKIVERYNPSLIVQFGSSLYRAGYNDVDIAVENTEHVGKVKNIKFLTDIQKEKWDVVLTSNWNKLKEDLGIRTEIILYTRERHDD